jgi:transcriptional regulator with XRE-family HTH domain
MNQSIPQSVQYATLAHKVDMLLRLVRQPDGRRYTYEDLERKSGIKSSTLSRIRSGENVDPYFKTIIAMADAFGVELDFFSTDMTIEQVEEYLTGGDRSRFLAEMRLQERNDALQGIALRAANLDDEGIKTIAAMIDYVLKQRGIGVEDE